MAAFGDIETGMTLERVDERINLHFGVDGKITSAGRPAGLPLGIQGARPGLNRALPPRP